jgi:hypothetical protein
MGSILHEKNIQNFLKNIDNPSAFDFNQLNEDKLNQALSEEPKSKMTFHEGTMKGVNRFCNEIQFNCPESRRNAHFADSLKMEFELREIFRQYPQLGDRQTQLQKDIYQGLSLNCTVFVNSFNVTERLLTFLVYLKVQLSKNEKLGDGKEYVIILSERKTRKKIIQIAKAVGVLDHLNLIWLDKTNKMYKLGAKGEMEYDGVFKDMVLDI